MHVLKKKASNTRFADEITCIYFFYKSVRFYLYFAGDVVPSFSLGGPPTSPRSAVHTVV